MKQKLIVMQQGENDGRSIKFNVSKQLAMFAGAPCAAQLAIQRPGDVQPYKIDAAITAGCIVWQPTAHDTEMAGYVLVQPVLTAGDVTLKARIRKIRVNNSLV